MVHCCEASSLRSLHLGRVTLLSRFPWNVSHAKNVSKPSFAKSAVLVCKHLETSRERTTSRNFLNFDETNRSPHSPLTSSRRRASRSRAMATESAPPLKELKKLKVAELKALLKTRGLEDSGLKDDLVRRLHDARQVADAGAGGEAAAVGSPAVDPPLQVTTSGDATAGPTASDPTGTPPTEDDEADAIAADGDDAIDEQHAIDEADAIAIDEADDEEKPPNAPGSHETEDTSLAPLAGGEPESNQVLSNPRVDRARGRLVVNSNDLDAWEVLVTEATAAGVPTGRSLFEEIVQTHPTSAKVWRAYAECEIAPAGNTRDDDAVKSIFSRCLLNCPSPDLWRSYTRYVLGVSQIQAHCLPIQDVNHFSFTKVHGHHERPDLP